MSNQQPGPSYQFWRKIEPVEGEMIPEFAEYKRRGDVLGSWKRPTDSEFTQMYTRFQWRVPVPVIPEDVAVEVVMQHAKEHADRWFVELQCEELIAWTKPELRELVRARLREMSQESITT